MSRLVTQRPPAADDAAYLQLLRSTDPQLAAAACAALIRRGDPASVDRVVAVLRACDRDHAERLWAVVRAHRSWPVARALLARA